MICPKCTYEFLDGFTFCPQCGQKIPGLTVTPEDPTKSSGDEAKDHVSTDPSAEDKSSAETTDASVFVHDSGRSDPDEDILESSLSATPVTDAARTPSVSAVAAVPVPPIPVTKAPAPVIAPLPVNAVNAAKPVSAAQDATGTDKTVTAEEPVIPKSLKPITTAGTFWFFLLTCVPAVGLLVMIIMAAFSRNKSRRSMSRAILIWRLILLLAVCVVFTVLFFANQQVLVNLFNFRNWYETAGFLAKTFLNY